MKYSNFARYTSLSYKDVFPHTFSIYSIFSSKTTKQSRKLFGIANFNDLSLVFQIPCEDRCLHPQTPPFWMPLRGSNYRSSQGMTGGFWKTRVLFELEPLPKPPCSTLPQLNNRWPPGLPKRCCGACGPLGC